MRQKNKKKFITTKNAIFLQKYIATKIIEICRNSKLNMVFFQKIGAFLIFFCYIINYHYNMNIIENIFSIRKEKGITQEVIADALFVDTSVISNIEKGKRDLRVKELEKIANVLGVDLLYLITYPHVYEKKTKEEKEKIPKVILQIELEDEVKADAIKLALGDRFLEIKG